MSSKRMPAGVFDREGSLVIRDVPVPTISHHQDVLIRVEACGVCGTDLRILAIPPAAQARLGVVLGHEYIGTVAEIGAAVRHLEPGDRVAVMPDLPCGYCQFCIEGRPNLCRNMLSIGADIDGGFAPYTLAPAKSLFKIDPDLCAEDGAFIELLSCVMGGVHKAALLPGEDVVIIGAGPAGLTYMRVFQASGAGQVIMVEISPWRIEFARRMGADAVINPQHEDLLAAVHQLTDGGAHVVVDAVGSQLPAAMAVARRGGRIVVFGEDHNARCTIRQQDIQGRELRLMGSFIGLQFFSYAVRALARSKVHVSDLITHRMSLEQLSDGIIELSQGRGAKGVCFPWQ